MKFDIAIIGSGPGGYVAAIRASQLGKKVAIIERENLGGICLNWGCIPTKALLKSAQVFDYINHSDDYGISIKDAKVDFDGMVKRSRGVADGMSKGIAFLMKKNKIEVINGTGKLAGKGKINVTDDKGKSSTVEADHIILATGARSRELPNIPIDGKKVTIVEFMDRILPVEDADVSKTMMMNYKKKGIEIMTNSSVEKVESKGGKSTVTIKTKKGTETKECDIVLSAAGVQTNLENLGLEEMGIKHDKGKIVVDDFYKTTAPGVYAIGDIVPGPALAHVASAEGIICVEAICGHHPQALNYGNIPGCTYTHPEVASVGLTEEQAKEKGYELRVGKFPFSASGKASASGHKDGFVKVIFDKKYGEWLGCHMMGEGVTDMIAEAVVARNLETTGMEVLKSVHPHPTMSEAVMEAVAQAYEECIHL